MEILHHKHQNTHKNLFLKKGGRGQHSITPTQTLVQHTLSMGPFLPVLLHQPSWECPFRKSLVLCPCWVTLESLSLSGCSLSIFHSVLLFPTIAPQDFHYAFNRKLTCSFSVVVRRLWNLWMHPALLWLHPNTVADSIWTVEGQSLWLRWSKMINQLFKLATGRNN